jgi:hypothetical protein
MTTAGTYMRSTIFDMRFIAVSDRVDETSGSRRSRDAVNHVIGGRFNW